ncbi:hypothetical protein PSP31120_01535 [Pandoraea sputorum]|nr:hypothetical protein PSP31120_01535 [Pandoraea sputorum]
MGSTQRRNEEPANRQAETERATCKSCTFMAKVFGLAYCTMEMTKAGEANMRRCNLHKEKRP